MSLLRGIVEIVDSLMAALAIGFLIIFSPLLNRWYRSWGATSDEVKDRMLGDEFVPETRLVSTRAITVRAPAAEVWPWLAQVGQGRGGWYSYEKLENLVGCQIQNADRILSEFQRPEVGEKIRLAPSGGPYFVVEEIDHGKAMVLGARNPKTDQPDDFSWTFAVREMGSSTSRLIVRSRNYYQRSLPNSLIWRVITDPVQFVMERKMLKTIKKRAEAATSS